MRRWLYAVRLWAWFAVRVPDAELQPFRWFLEAYDLRQKGHEC